MTVRRPNIVVIMTDQQRADALGCAGNRVLRTPHLDRLAARGVRFANAFTVAPLCMPARASLLSAGYPHNHGIWSNRASAANELPPTDETVFQRLRDAGYATAHVGKGHYYSWNGVGHLAERKDYVRALGFEHVHETTGPHYAKTVRSHMTDHWSRAGVYDAFKAGYSRRPERPWDVTPNPLSADEHLDSYVGRIGTEFVERHSGDRPFALFVGFGGPHEPWDAPGEYATMYEPNAIPQPIAAAEPGPWVPPAAAARMRTGRIDGLGAAQAQQVLANYYGKITLIDRCVGDILDAVERRGWGARTLVVFLSDHGEMAGDHRRLHKTVFYESSIRIPLVVSWPGQTPEGQTCVSLVESIDVVPTLLEAAGAPALRRGLGVSLWPALRDPTAAVREDVLSEVRDEGAGAAGDDPAANTLMLRTARHKYALSGSGEGYLLHDLAADPDEQVNLIGHPDHRALEADLRERLFRRVVRTQPPR